MYLHISNDNSEYVCSGRAHAYHFVLIFHYKFWFKEFILRVCFTNICSTFELTVDANYNGTA